MKNLLVQFLNAAERHISFCREQHAKTGHRAPKTSGGGNKPRSNSQPRNPPSRSPSQSRSSSRRPSTKANNNISPVSTGYGRAPATGASTKGRPIANSAGIRTSHLPTPVKRSNSAPRTVHAIPKTASSGYGQHGSTSGPRKSIPTSNGRDERRAPSTGKAASTSTSSTTSGRRPSQTRSKRQ
uniref:Uncharacterized protein n=1 Tax=Panagrolaimus superbus TaxID=310955 RepID=A0A914XVX5_9BILA